MDCISDWNGDWSRQVIRLPTLFPFLGISGNVMHFTAEGRIGGFWFLTDFCVEDACNLSGYSYDTFRTISSIPQAASAFFTFQEVRRIFSDFHTPVF